MNVQLAFDAVRLTSAEGLRVLPLDEFLALPIHKRVQHVLRREVEFLAGVHVIPRAQALRSLREWETTRPQQK